MTIHIALTEVAAGNASLDEVVPLPRQSWGSSQPPRSSLMGLAAGQKVTLGELLLGLAVSSGNDAAVAVALRFAPSVAEFADMMNREAEKFGLTQTHFVEPSGISEYNITTVREFTWFCKEYIRLHPGTLTELHSVLSFAYPKAENVAEAYRENPRTGVKQNGNSLLAAMGGRDAVEGVDGLKTGYIDEAGYNIALTAKREGTRFVAVALGAQWTSIRNADGQKLLTWAFDHFKTLVVKNPTLEPIRVWKGKTDSVDLIPEGSFTFTAGLERGTDIRCETEFPELVIAPVPAGTILGDLVIYDSFGELRRIPLAAAADIEQAGFWKRLWHSIKLFFRSIFA
jgi:D-alanyl-D-alanine carboxypeptidase (penicillin-binding protein 5/6)